MPVDSPPAPGVAEIPPALRDGYEVHRAALAHGMDVLLLPRQVLMASHPEGGPGLSFVHGIPESSTLSAVTYAQDKRMRRELLERAGLPVPPGATFAIGRELEEAKRYAERIGYPVVVKPAVGDNTIEVAADLRDEPALLAAIEWLRRPESERPTFTRAAYALTLLLEPDEEDGRALTPAGYQFLLESHVRGEFVRLMVLGDEVVCALHCPGGLVLAPDRPVRDLTNEVHASFREVAVTAARTVPGLTLAAVDVVLADHRRPAADQDWWIVEFSERPWLAVQAAVADDLPRRLGDQIFTYHAAETAVNLPAPAEEVAISFHVEGTTDPEGAVAAVAAAAQRSGLAAEISVTDRVEGTAGGEVRGPAGPIAAIFESLLDGRLDGQRAMLVMERQRSGRAQSD